MEREVEELRTANTVDGGSGGAKGKGWYRSPSSSSDPIAISFPCGEKNIGASQDLRPRLFAF